MDFYKKDVFSLFDGSRTQFTIPVYQRAYAWEEPQWSTFLNDLLEHLEGKNNYFYGNILLEASKDSNGGFEIIDGQQRITTLSIFIRSLINVLSRRKEERIDLEEKEKVFIKYGGKPKLRPVEYDELCYTEIIVNNKDTYEVASPSQQRILDAKQYFQEKLEMLNSEQLLTLFDKLERTALTTIIINDKKEAALMFELQNNRGKDLTNMERLKSYLMYQMYVYNDGRNDTEQNINYLASIFEEIYRTINRIKSLDEDSVLIYHNNAYNKKGYSYRNLEDVKEEFKRLTSNTTKIEWIKSYVSELKTTFDNIEKFENLKNREANKLRNVGMPAYAWAFVIRGYKYLGDDRSKLSELFQILEKVIFRAKLINSRANIQERLNSIMLGFEGDLAALGKDIRKKLNEARYWSDDMMKTYLDSNMYGNKVLNYLLWEYEDHIQNRGYRIDNVSLENEQIEHISPQTPEEGEEFATGYETPYDEEFEKNYLNRLGNLMLISGSHNASIGNKPFKDKLASYNKNPLLNQQAEIKDFCSQEKWGKEQIQKRHYKILNFCLERWQLIPNIENN